LQICNELKSGENNGSPLVITEVDTNKWAKHLY